MITITTVLRGEILSGTDRSRSKATGQFLTAQCHQRRLAFIHHQIRRAGLYGKGDTEVIRGIEYRAVFGPDWLIEADVQFVLGSRHKNQLPDIDNIWSAFQNAMAFPAAKLKVTAPVKGRPLYTVVPNDRQFTRYTATHIPDPLASRTQDLVIARFTAFPPPALALVVKH
jgi:hypothetical protein